MNTSLLGRWGEAQALEYLKRKGFVPLAAGYRTRFGEIDLIVSNKKYIVFAEVKLRKSAAFADAREFVDAHKRERLRKTALMWLSEHETALQPRFDVLEVYAPEGIKTRSPEINHIENAFE